MSIQGPKIETAMPTLPVAAPASAVSEAERPVAPQPVKEEPRVVRSLSIEQMRDLKKQIADRLEEYLRKSGRNLELRVDEDAKATVITVRRADTGEVVRQFPSEEALALLRRLNDHSGTLLDVVT